MSMRIILEGPDGAGKTTLARVLQDRFRTLKYHKEGPPPAEKSALHHYGEVFLNAPADTVFDRLALGELIYGPIWRGGDRLGGWEGYRLMERLFAAQGGVTVVCLPSFSACLRAHANRGQAPPPNFERTYRRWSQLAGLLEESPRVFIYSWERGAAELSRLITWLRRPRRVLPRGYVGSPTAWLLLVGEQPNGPLDLPFFSVERSSHFLTTCLWEAGYDERELAFTNAFSPDGRVRPLTEARFPLVAALGRKASEALRRQSIPHEYLHHPQYWRRFQAGAREVYVQRLRDLREKFNAVA